MMKYLLAFSLILITSPALVWAAGYGGWNVYTSDTGLYSVELPREPEIIRDKLRVSPDYEVYSEEMLSVINQTDYKNSLKTYSVKIDQTWGPGIHHKEVPKFLDEDLEHAVRHVKESGGKLLEAFKHESGEYIEYHYSYEDSELGTQGIRTRIHYSDTMRIKQSVSGPLDIMTNTRTERFLESLQFNRGYTKNVSAFEDWEDLDSPLGLFTMPHPYGTGTFFPYEPKVENNEKTEKVTMVFYDPVRAQYLYYNIYGYRFSQPVNEIAAKRVLARYHSAKYNPIARDIKFKAMQRAGIPVLEHEAGLSKVPDKAPYMNMVKLRGQYRGNALVVQELVGNHMLARSNFANNLLNLLEFIPQSTGEDSAAESAPEPIEPQNLEANDPRVE